MGPKAADMPLIAPMPIAAYARRTQAIMALRRANRRAPWARHPFAPRVIAVSSEDPHQGLGRYLVQKRPVLGELAGGHAVGLIRSAVVVAIAIEPHLVIG